MADQFGDIQDWASVGGGEGDPVEPTADIEDYIDTFFASLGTLTEDSGTIPGTATERPRGAFTDFNDMQQYLDSGGLTIYDGSGNLVPNPIVYIFKSQPTGSTKVIYEVWIDEDT